MRDIPQLKAEFFKTLGHPMRVRLLELLVDGERSVSQLLEHLSAEQPAVSQQLGVLRRAGFVVARRDGANVLYRLADPRVSDLLTLAKQMLVDLFTNTRDELSRS